MIRDRKVMHNFFSVVNALLDEFIASLRVRATLANNFTRSEQNIF